MSAFARVFAGLLAMGLPWTMACNNNEQIDGPSPSGFTNGQGQSNSFNQSQNNQNYTPNPNTGDVFANPQNGFTDTNTETDTSTDTGNDDNSGNDGDDSSTGSDVTLTFNFPHKDSNSWSLIVNHGNDRHTVPANNGATLTLEDASTSNKEVLVTIYVIQDGAEYDTRISGCAVGIYQGSTLWFGFDSECDEENFDGSDGWEDTDDIIVTVSANKSHKVKADGLVINNSIDTTDWY